jgi:arylsulfatase A-like enzyme
MPSLRVCSEIPYPRVLGVLSSRFASILLTLIATTIFASGVKLALAAEAPSSARKPNIVFILADDLGYSDLGCYGSEIETPHLDRLAQNGVRFTQFYNTARCWPSRAALLTGYYAQQVNRDPQGTRPKWAALLPELLREAGYRSYHSGKWHIDGKILDAGFSRSYHTTDHDRFFSPRHHQLDDQALPPPGSGEKYYATTATADRAIEWLAEHQSGHPQKPFFLYLAFIAPHFPLHALPEDIARYRDRYQPGWNVIRAGRWKRMQTLGLVAGELSAPEPNVAPSWNLSEADLQKRIGPGESGRAVNWTELTAEQQQFQAQKMAIHAAMIDRMDREIGRVLEKIRAMQAWDDTLICFASDNGASAEQIIRGDGHTPGAEPGSAQSYLGLGPGWSTVSNTPFRRHKSWNHEGGTSTPLIAHWPRGIAARGELRHAPGHLVDVAPTLLELAGVVPPAEWNGQARPKLPGRSLVPFFARDTDVPHDAIYFRHTEHRGLRLGDWKIVSAGKNGPWELYDLTKDRAESHNLAEKHPEKLKELVAIWTERDAEYHRQGSGRTD